MPRISVVWAAACPPAVAPKFLAYRGVVGLDSFDPYYDPALKRARLERLQASSSFAFTRADVADRAAMDALFAQLRPRRVVHQHRVEGALEPQRAHVTRDVLALRIQLAAEALHRLGDVGQRALEAMLQVKRVVPRTGTELEQRSRPRRRRPRQRIPIAHRLVEMILVGVDESVPGHELVIQQR